ncbi:MAG: SOS response-associated peptidase [Myxococcota bacterium]|nr:SOS response-associated peptidase [Myxococcota bacterium]
MCGRYTVAIQAQEAAEELRATLTFDDAAPRYNLAPTQDAPIAIQREERRIGLARFGLVPAESDGPKAAGARWINLRAESVAGQRAFAESAARRRCLVIADGFFEWKREGKSKQAWYFRPAGGGLLTFAGIWDVWEGAASGDAKARIPSFAILTTTPTEVVADIHDRMPMIVPPALRDRWLSPSEDDARAVIRAIRDADPVPLESWKVGPRVGSVANDDPTLIEPTD